ncbi:SusC/RagA family TonB-linked outer membrane protein [Zobellia russellii]|uniref:SusC/RagA family TonB-linked outer membrane protein n=1 Tax=Zobellia russellii TaxID=248907 RepID=UPI001BFEF797|nr:TonB-dependent receptor [Zobellia russellii]MBT9190426.1 TonB-dependent receptor [Zobellia russellii]
MKKFLDQTRRGLPLLKLNLKMKISMLFMFMVLFTMQAKTSYSQVTKISLDLNNVSVERIIDEIESQTEFHFVYQIKDVDLKRVISVKATKETVPQILTRIFAKTRTTHRVVDKQIFLKERRIANLNHDKNVVQQKLVVTGTVTDTNGQPLPGANIVEKGTTNGVTADFDGNFSLEVATDAIIMVSYIGFASKEVPVNGETIVNISLEESAAGLEEVVVIGYGTTKKRDLTGSVASVSGSDIEGFAGSRAIESLQGKAAGINIVRASGTPGDGVKVRIRGIGTINNSNPLYVIDGVPSNDMDNVDVNDIENIEILKDASATAIYGSRGANGVVMVITKSGDKAIKPTFSFNQYYSLDHIQQYDLTKGYEFAELYKEAMENDGTPFSGDKLQLMDDAIANRAIGTNWQDEVFQKGNQENYQFSVTGGITGKENRKVDYYVSTSYNNVKGTVKNTAFNRFNLIGKLNLQFNEFVKAGIDIRYTSEERNGQRGQQDFWGSPISQALSAHPLMPVYMEDGSWGDMWFNEQQSNPAAKAEFDKTQNLINANFNPRAWLELGIFKSLKFKTIFSYSNSFDKRKDYVPSYRVNSVQVNENSTLTEARSNAQSWYWNNVLTFNKNFAEKHDLTLTLGHEAQGSKNDGISVTATAGVPEDEALRYINRGTEFGNPLSMVGQSGLESYFGRLNYVLNDRYILTATVRTDGSYKFAPGNKWGTFPSVGFAWRLSDEAFIENLDVFSNLKFRAGWGRVGNQSSAAAFTYLSTVNRNNMYYSINGVNAVQGGIPTATVNPDLQWETVESTNFGLDFSFMQGKLGFTADYFLKETRDMIVQVPTPQYTSNTDPFQNVGKMENKGYEFSTNYSNNVGDLYFNVGANISFLSNEVTDLGTKDFIQGGRTNNKISPEYITRTEVGEEFAYFIGYEGDGIYTSQEQIDNSGLNNTSNITIGDARFVDKNNDGELNEEDYIKLGSAIPDYTWGFNGSLNYKSIDFGFTLVGVEGVEAVNALRPHLLSGEGFRNLLPSRLNRYHPVNNPTGTEPRMTVQDPNENFSRMSDRYVEDGSFLKVRTIQLGYTLPVEIIEKIHLNKFRIYVSAQNMFTITKYSGFDPEIAELTTNNNNSSLASGIDLGNYPIPRSLILGVNLSF